MVINPFLLTSSINLGIVLTLLVSIFFLFKAITSTATNTPKGIQGEVAGINLRLNEGHKTQAYSPGPFMIEVLKALSLLSIVSLTISMASKFRENKLTFSLWIKKTATKISIKILQDQYFLTFLTVALIVTWSIIEFSYYYMSEDPKSTAFFRLLIIFLLKMLILTCSKSLFMIFLGWEGVGFLSFLLIRW